MTRLFLGTAAAIYVVVLVAFLLPDRPGLYGRRVLREPACTPPHAAA
jgi:hypothetical protein